MVRNIIVLGGNSHPTLTATICEHLGISPGQILLSKFAVGETRVEIKESVRSKDVFIIQSGGGKINDHLMELLITISACKIASANRITVVLPLFPYSRQTDIPYDRLGNPLMKTAQAKSSAIDDKSSQASSSSLSVISRQTSRNSTSNLPKDTGTVTTHQPLRFEAHRGYRQWVAQAGKLVAELLTCAGTDHVITMDLHDPQYQGFFDIPVDNLFGRQLLKRYIAHEIPNYQNAVIVSPDAGGAKRATAIADQLSVPFALIHKERRPTDLSEKKIPPMLVGDVRGRTAILIDDLADTCTTILMAGRLLKRQGATKVYALLTHGIFSGDSIERLKGPELDKIVVTNSVDQSQHKEILGDKLVVLEVGDIFAEAIRRVHHGESISVLFNKD